MQIGQGQKGLEVRSIKLLDRTTTRARPAQTVQTMSSALPRARMTDDSDLSHLA